MSDLVERLRAGAPMNRHLIPEATAAMSEAADRIADLEAEIARLREDIVQRVKFATEQDDTRAEVEEDISRLREALREARTVLQQIASGEAFQPRLHAKSGVAAIDQALEATHD